MIYEETISSRTPFDWPILFRIFFLFHRPLFSPFPDVFILPMPHHLPLSPRISLSRKEMESDPQELSEEDEWDVCLSDFGLSAQKNRSELMTQLCGTPAFTGTATSAAPVPSPFGPLHFYFAAITLLNPSVLLR